MKINGRALLNMLAVSALLTGCTQNRILTQSAVIDADNPRSNSTVVAQQGDLAITAVRLNKRFKEEYVAGTLKNMGDKPYQYVEVAINCFDQNNQLIDTALGTHGTLRPNGVWKFKLRLTQPQVIDHYQVANINAW